MPGPAPVLPAYGGACLAGLVPALLNRQDEAPGWLPSPAREADQVVLLVLDGLGWLQLRERAALAPTLTAMEGGPITSVAPTTTATALTSLTTGLVPAAHGVVGYRMRVGSRDVLNVLRWRTAEGDAKEAVPPERLQPVPAFGGTGAPAVTRAEFAHTGFTLAHLGGAKLRGWRVPSSVAVEVQAALGAGEPFVYAYYDGIDKVAHERGLGAHYDAELAFVDHMVADLCERLPRGAAVVVTSDHGQVGVGEAVQELEGELLEYVELLSGEGRFRWLHARPGAELELADAARAAYGDLAWVRTRDELVEEGWFGGRLRPEVAQRLGDVALVAHAPVAFLDPADTGEVALVARHGSLTEAEMWVPLLAWAR